MKGGVGMRIFQLLLVVNIVIGAFFTSIDVSSAGQGAGVLWEQRYKGYGGGTLEIPSSLTVDSAGRVYVTGADEVARRAVRVSQHAHGVGAVGGADAGGHLVGGINGDRVCGAP